MKKTRLLICLALVFVMLFGAMQVFATEETTEPVEETTAATEEQVATAAPSADLGVCAATGGEHQFQEGWKSSTEEHWHYCQKCKKKIGVEKHEFGEPDANYQMTCVECGKKVDVPHVHEFSEEWSFNVYKHFHACTATYGLKGGDFCKGCREKGAQHEYDSNGVCTICGEQDHTFGEDGLCTVCGAEDVYPDERPGDAGILWIVLIVIAVVGAAASVVVLVVKKKN